MVKVKTDLSHRRFGALEVLHQDEDHVSLKGTHYARWKCKCDCGNIVSVLQCNLLRKNRATTSCGCYKESVRGKNFKRSNDYEVQEDYVILYTTKGEPFFVDLDDFWRVKDICWSINKHGYLVGRKHGVELRLHSFIMNAPKGAIVDHVGGNSTKHDNRKYNLRFITRNFNATNAKLHTNNTSGVTGVCWNKRSERWQVRISIDGKEKSLGYFDKLEDAIAVRKAAETKYYGEYSYDNSQKLAKQRM